MVTGWLVAAVATGHGVAAADTTGTSSSESSTSTSASSGDSSAASSAAASDSATGGSASTPAKSSPPSVGIGNGRDRNGVERKSKSKSKWERKASSTSQPTEQPTSAADTDSVGVQEESTVPTTPTETTEAPVEAVSSMPEKVREAVRQLSDVFDKPALSLPEPASPRASDTAPSEVPDGVVSISDTLNRSVARVEQVTAKATERVAEKISEQFARPDMAATADEVEAVLASAASDMQATAEATATAVATPVARVVVPAPADGAVGVLGGIVTNILNPFLAPDRSTPEPVNPASWAVLAWVRRNLFNQAPVISNPTTTVQTGQTVTGNIGVTDAEGDELTYTVTEQPKYGTVTIDQETGEFTYTPDDINYDAAQMDSFTVSVTDGDKVNLLALFKPRTAQNDIDVTVLNPTLERVILDLPDGITNPNTPRFAGDGQSLYFAATPAEGGREEIYQVSVDGTNVECITCGVSTDITGGLGRVDPFDGGTGRLMIQVRTSPNSYVVYEETAEGKQLVPVISPPAGTRVLDPQREMRISPDGKYVLFSQIQMNPDGLITAIPVVGRLERTDAGYEIADARVVAPVGEGKQWTPDGKGVIILGGRYEAGNVDDIVVDLETGEVTRLTGNLDYDEDIDMSPNEQWIAVGSTRGYDALTPMSRIVRPAFLPADIQGAVYEAYRGTGDSTNITNQEWVIAIEDDLKGETGIPVFVDGDGYTARSMASWNNTGDAVAFWEASQDDETDTRLVIANLDYTTSVGPVEGDLRTPDPTWAPELSSYVPSAAPLPPTGTYAGAGGGTAVVSEVTDATGRITRTVTYTDYVNEEGMILNGTESTDTTASQSSIRYVADITVTGEHTGYLRADATVNKLQRTMTGHITSEVDGDVLSILDQERIDEDRANM
ncbi:Ig-like domain-containing protein [Mycolicibacterium sp. XJ870]